MTTIFNLTVYICLTAMNPDGSKTCEWHVRNDWFARKEACEAKGEEVKARPVPTFSKSAFMDYHSRRVEKFHCDPLKVQP